MPPPSVTAGPIRRGAAGAAAVSVAGGAPPDATAAGAHPQPLPHGMTPTVAADDAASAAVAALELDAADDPYSSTATGAAVNAMGF